MFKKMLIKIGYGKCNSPLFSLYFSSLLPSFVFSFLSFFLYSFFLSPFFSIFSFLFIVVKYAKSLMLILSAME